MFSVGKVGIEETEGALAASFAFASHQPLAKIAASAESAAVSILGFITISPLPFFWNFIQASKRRTVYTRCGFSAVLAALSPIARHRLRSVDCKSAGSWTMRRFRNSLLFTTPLLF